MPTTLVNLRKTKLYDVKIDRDTEFGNHYKIGIHGDRKQVLEKYRTYFYNRILTDKKFLGKILNLKGKVLACWCCPLDCHGDVIIEFLDGTKNEKPHIETTDFFDC